MERRISRRTMLRRAAAVTTGIVAASSAKFSEANSERSEAAAAPDHDPASGEIFDRDRHHRWDTV